MASPQWLNLSPTMKMQFQYRNMLYRDNGGSNHGGNMNSLRYQFMETEAFHSLMEESMLDPSPDGGNEETSLPMSSRRADSTCRDRLHSTDLPDSVSCGIYDKKIRKKSHHHQVKVGSF